MTLKGRLWTLSELNTEVAAYIDDASYARWSSAEVDRAIKAAVRASSHVWFEERLDASHSYAIATQTYALPPACENVLEVWFAPISANQPRHLIPMSSWRVEGTDLVMQQIFTAYDTKAMYIHYMVRPANLLAIGQADGQSYTSTKFTSALSTFITHGVRPGDALVITSGADVGTHYVAVIVSNTEVTLHAALTATAGPGISFIVEQQTDLPFDYIMHFAMAWIYELAGRNRPGVEVSDVVQWANYYRQLADLDLKRNARRPRPVRRYN